MEPQAYLETSYVLRGSNREQLNYDECLGKNHLSW